jgi:YVTN family beta-propeller protein
MKSKDRGSVVGTLFLLLVACTNWGCGGGSASTPPSTPAPPVAASVSGTIAVGIAPSGVAVDPTANKIYVANFGNVQSPASPCGSTDDSVTIIDGATDSTSTIADGIGFESTNPLALAVDSANHGVYVIVQVNNASITRPYPCDSSFKPGYLAVVSGTTFTLAGFPVGLGGLRGIGVDALANEIYVGYVNPNTGAPSREVVAAINGSSNAIASWVTLGGAPAALAVNPATNKTYVVLAGEIDVIDGATDSLTKVADVGAAGRNVLAVNPSTNTIYMANSQSGNLSVIDGETDSITATIAVGTTPSGVDVDPQTNFIYVANAGNSQSGDPGNVTVIDGTTNATTTLVDPNATNPVAVAVNSATHKVYVANRGSNNVTVIDGAHD